MPLPASFPWDEALAAGLGFLRLPPDHFWRMTPRELAAALGAMVPQPAAGLRRAEMEALMRRFPDETR